MMVCWVMSYLLGARKRRSIFNGTEIRMASSPLKLWSYLKPSFITVTYSRFLWCFPSPPPLERCQSGRVGRIRNPLCLHRYLGFESLSLRHTNESPADQGLRGFFVSGLYYSLAVTSLPVASLRRLYIASQHPQGFFLPKCLPVSLLGASPFINVGCSKAYW